MSWPLIRVDAADIDELMTWFPDARSVDVWAGPKFPFPFDRQSFHAGCCWQEFASYGLRNPSDELAAFGQLGSRYGRSHLARLISNPAMRRQGVGRRLLESLIDVARRERDCAEVGLFVYRNNIPAYRCYRSVGFEVQDYPEGAPYPDLCYYLTRPIA